MNTAKNILLVFISLAFLNCSDDSDNNSSEEIISIVGKWQLISRSYDGVEAELGECDLQSTFEFTEMEATLVGTTGLRGIPNNPPCDLSTGTALYSQNETELSFYTLSDTDFNEVLFVVSILKLTSTELVLLEEYDIDEEEIDDSKEIIETYQIVQ